MLEGLLIAAMFAEAFLLGMLVQSLFGLVGQCWTRSSSKSPSRSSTTSNAESLQASLRLTLMAILFAFVVLAAGLASGCGSRVVLVPETSPVRVGPNVRGRVYTMVDGQWQISDNEVLVPEGHYIVSPRWVDGELP